jgi:phage nucleotide-binding protein
MNITKASDLSIADANWRVMLYGAAGVGKTSFLKTCPRPLLVLDFDQKEKPLFGEADIDIISYKMESPDSCRTMFPQFLKDWKEIKALDKYATIALDSLTSLDTIALKYFTLLSGKQADATATLPVYQDLMNWYIFFFAECKYIKQNLLILAHESYEVDELEGIHSIQPLITGKSASKKIPALFEEIWYIERQAASDKRILHYRPWKKTQAFSTGLTGKGELELGGWAELMKLARVIKAEEKKEIVKV